MAELLKIIIKLMAVLSFLVSVSFAEPLQVSVPPPQSESDTRNVEIMEILKTALEVTIPTDGDYLLETSDTTMNPSRFRYQLAKGGSSPNIVWFTATSELERELRSVPVPIIKGLLGYRVFLIKRSDQDKFRKIQTLEELKALWAGQGATWPDVDILRANDFNVETGFDYQGLFDMLMHGRFDYFPRGVNEVVRECESMSKLHPDMVIEQSILLHYPYPYFFYVGKDNQRLAERLEKGLKMMIEDGSYEKIFLKYNQQNIEQLNLNNRKIFYIDNPILPGSINLTDHELWFQP